MPCSVSGAFNMHDGGIYIPFSAVTVAGLDPTTIARVLDLETSTDTLVVTALAVMVRK